MDLFSQNENKELPKKVERENEFEWNQFCKLGEMMGDGLHHEPDGKWISREYRRLAKILIPEIKEQDKERRKLKAKSVDTQMQKLLEVKTCSCGGKLRQSRAGSKIAYCTVCNGRYKARTVKKRKN